MTIYRTYVFREKDPVIDLLRTAVQDSGLSYKEIEAKSRVRISTQRAWFQGKTKRPQFATLQAVARSCGKNLALEQWSPKTRHSK